MNLLDANTLEATLLTSYTGGPDDAWFEDCAAEAAFHYAHDALMGLVAGFSGPHVLLAEFRADIATLATPALEWVANEITAIADHALVELGCRDRLAPLDEELDRLAADGMLRADQRDGAKAWLADLLWYGHERTPPAAVRTRSVQLRRCELALILTGTVLTTLPRPHDALADYQTHTYDV